MTREQLELEAERNREAVAGTIEELQERLTPGEIVDQVMSYMQDGGNEFLRNLGRQVTANPMPVTLIGAGVAWMLFAKNAPSSGAGSHSSSGSYSPDTYSSDWDSRSRTRDTGSSSWKGNGEDGGMGERARSAAHKVGDVASSAGEGISEAYHSMQDRASNLYQDTADRASSAYQEAADKLSAAKNSAIEYEQRAVESARSAWAFCRDQPLVLVGLGLALGAAMGAAFPSTEVENRLMGETSDQLKEAAKETASEQLDKAKEYGRQAGEQVSQTLTEDIQSAGGPIGSGSESYRPKESYPQGGTTPH